MSKMDSEFKTAGRLVKNLLKKLEGNTKVTVTDKTDAVDEDLFHKILSADKLKEKNDFYQRVSPDTAYQRVQRKIDTKRKKSPVLKILAYAAVLMVAVGISGWFFLVKSDRFFVNETPEIAVDLEAGSKKAVLVLNNGEKVALNSSEMVMLSQDSSIVNQNNGLVYNHNERAKGFNTLQVPKGGIYSVELSDGTRVWLNSESSLRYPVSFQGKTRTVELNGEAYFEVAENKDSPFIVQHGNFKLKVLGTVFNINAYEKESENKISLLSGKISLSNLNLGSKAPGEVILNPGQQALLNLKIDNLEIGKTNVSMATAWVQGRFYFKNENLATILDQMERWYGFTAKYENKQKADIRFTGVIKKDKSLREILDIISKTSNINYTIHKKENNYEVIIK